VERSPIDLDPIDRVQQLHQRDCGPQIYVVGMRIFTKTARPTTQSYKGGKYSTGTK